MHITCKESGIFSFSFRFKDFTGKDLMRLKKVLHSAPEFYHSSLRDDLKLSLLHILRFSEALENV